MINEFVLFSGENLLRIYYSMSYLRLDISCLDQLFNQRLHRKCFNDI